MGSCPLQRSCCQTGSYRSAAALALADGPARGPIYRQGGAMVSPQITTARTGEHRCAADGSAPPAPH